MSIQIATSSWFKNLDAGRYCRIGISRGVPRGHESTLRYPKLNPGPWFTDPDAERFTRNYYERILAPLDAATVVRELSDMAQGRIPTLLCWEPPTPSIKWCHRALVSSWLKRELDLDVYEVDYEHEGCGAAHPKHFPAHREQRRVNRFDDILPHIGARFTRGTQTFEVVSLDPVETDQAVLAVVGTEPRETMQVSVDLVLQYLGVAPARPAAPSTAKPSGGKKGGKGKIVGQQTLL